MDDEFSGSHKPGLHLAVAPFYNLSVIATMPSKSSTENSHYPGALIAIEGGDGIGKSTLIPILAAALEKETGRPVKVFREPGGTPFGEDLRTVVKAHGNRTSGIANVLAFSASRAELMARQILPAVERGDIVLVDRFLLSTYMYQGRGQGVPSDVIATITEIAVGGNYPDATVVLTLSPEEWKERHSSRKAEEGDGFEEDADAAQRVQKAYLEDAHLVPGTVIVSAKGAPPEIAERVVSTLRPLVRRLFQYPTSKITR